MKKNITFKIQRYKQGDEKPYFEQYIVECDVNTTVLVALQEIRREEDQSLMLRHSCHHASCGTCGIEINGRERLACITNVFELDKDKIVVKPLPDIPLISDLVVDMGYFYYKYNTPKMSYLRSSEYIANAKTPSNIDNYTRLETCIECGICYAGCPITTPDDDYIGPAALAAAWRVVEVDNNGRKEEILEWVDSDSGCWRCSVAFECSEVCPVGVDPAGAIMNLRRTLVKNRVKRFLGFGGRSQ